MRWQAIDVDDHTDEARFEGDPAELIDAAGFLAELTRRPAWQRLAACRGLGTASWFPARGDDVRPAKAVCAGCPVRDECLQFALEGDFHTVGIWGGYSERNRHRLRRGDIAA